MNRNKPKIWIRKRKWKKKIRKPHRIKNRNLSNGRTKSVSVSTLSNKLYFQSKKKKTRKDSESKFRRHYVRINRKKNREREKNTSNEPNQRLRIPFLSTKFGTSKQIHLVNPNFLLIFFFLFFYLFIHFLLWVFQVLVWR